MKPFDLTTVYNEKRPLSWSAISCFKWRPSDWYSRYVLKEEIKITQELVFGKKIDMQIQDDPTFLPELVRYPILQHHMSGTFNGIPLIGYADTYAPPIKYEDKKGAVKTIAAIRDYKTGRKKWDQKRADETGQLTMYLFMLYLRDKIRPEDVECFIDWLPTCYLNKEIVFIEPFKIHTFKTKRSMKQLLEFGQHIKDTWEAMEEYAARQEKLEVHNRVDW